MLSPSDHAMALYSSQMPLPDPSQYPDPYPNMPGLSSGPSSSASTRSSAYTSSGSTLPYVDYSNVHVASGDDDPNHVDITKDAVAQMLASDPAHSPSARVPSSKSQDRSRWSESYSGSILSRSSSFGHSLASGNPPEAQVPSLSQKQSYDVSWQSVDERDETGISEDETDDEPGLDSLDADDEDVHDEEEEERTSAAVVADEGRGLIVHGDNVPIVQLQVQPGTTHLLIGSSSTPNTVPAFLTTTLPQIAHSLLALDISANFLGALPPVLAVCENLEELNVASNPLRVLPVFLADLVNLRVLIADSTGINTLPEQLVDLDKLHTISIRRNKLHALPSWLCLLPALQTLCVDGNPFQGPWKALVDPLLAKAPATPVYPTATPTMPLSAQTSYAGTETDGTDESDHEEQSPQNGFTHSPEEEDHTITQARVPHLSRSTTAPAPAPPTRKQPLVRTRTTPNRTYFEQTRSGPGRADGMHDPRGNRAGGADPVGRSDGPPPGGDHEIRKMKSAGDLRRPRTGTSTIAEAEMPHRPQISKFPTSVSSSNLLNGAGDMGASPSPDQYNKRFASLGPNSQHSAMMRPSPNAARPQLSQSMFQHPSPPPPPSSGPPMAAPAMNDRTSSYAPPPANTLSAPPMSQPVKSEGYASVKRPQPATREKSTRWGFLKKMSMGKMKPDPNSPPPPSPHPTRPPISRPHTSSGSGAPHLRPGDRISKSPQIDLRLSTTSNMLDSLPALSPPPPASPNPPRIDSLPGAAKPMKGSNSLTVPQTPIASNGLLSPPVASHPRTTKRRSFLPIDAPGSMSLTIPENSAFVTGVVVTEGDEAPGQPQPSTQSLPPPSPELNHEQYMRREADRARDAYARALRSVMAYLRDMNDLVSIQQVGVPGVTGAPRSMYGDSQLKSSLSADDEYSHSRQSRAGSGPREASMIATSLSDSTAQLRSSESMAGMRSGTSSQTLSVATTDSAGSGEERKFKDDKGKRAMVVREIIATERTYVKGLQELMDIYIKPAGTPANLLSGVGSSSKDTVVPAPERRVVFGGVDSLFSFHCESFLPALEAVAAPLMKPASEVDQDGQLSIEVARAVGNIFVKHAAFMRMYSSYINNFDNAVQRVKYWTSDKSSPAPAAPALTTSSSTAQLAGLGIGMAMASNPALLAETSAAATGIPNLTTSQKRRIKSYLKRCRLNPRHTQLNLEGYLLLPVQRVPRYKLLLEELLRSTPPLPQYMDDPLDRALAEIALLANNMNEGKRESESRRKLVQWQARIRGKFPSPLVQPHRRLIMDGPLLLTRVVRKAVVTFEAINPQGDASIVQVDCLSPELTPRPLIGILCNDLLVLCRDASEGQDPTSPVDLWAVLRMQTRPQPASIVHGNGLRLVDNKAILYFDAPSSSDALNWFRAINLHIPASKT